MHLSTDFWRSAAERAIRSAAAAMLAVLGTGMIGLVGVDWVNLLSIGGGAALVSVLTSIAASEVGTKGTTFFIGAGK